MRNHKRKARRMNSAMMDSIDFGLTIMIGGTKYRGRSAEYKRVVKTDKKTGITEVTFEKIVNALPFVRVD